MADQSNRFVTVICTDRPGPDAGVARQEHLPAHLAYVEGIIDQFLVAGPLYDDDGVTIIGSLYIFKTDDVAVARQTLSDDPYLKADFWADVKFYPFLGAAGDAVGGTSY